ncbi:MAG: hypothetical protein HQK68_12590, partial [Desulfamplus sp.]|nr:hypothetical protein [Desulfamplus sp.]
MNNIPTTHNKNCFVFFLLSIFILIIYSNTFNSSWHFDDFGNIIDNPRINITDLYPDTIKKTFYALPEESGGKGESLYRPVAMLSFALNWYIGQDNTFGYHVVNSAIHIFTSFLLFLSIYHLLRSPNIKPIDESLRYQIALLSATLWAIHPIQIQSVTYIVQRMASMAAMFYIAGIYFYLKIRFTDSIYKKIGFALCCIIMFFLSVGSKQNGALMPISILLMEIIFFQNISNFLNTKRIWLIIVFLVLIIASGVFSIYFFYDGNLLSFLKGYEARSFTFIERILTQPRVICLYLYQIIYPIASQFSIDHEIEISRNLIFPWTTLPAILFIILIITAGFYNVKKRPLISFAILFFFLNHTVESTIFPLELIFEHRNYIPSMFLFVPATTIIIFFFERYKQMKEKQFFLKLCVLMTIMVISAIGLGTYTRNFDWLTEKSLWESGIEKAPGNARPYQNLAVSYYQKEGLHDKALELHTKAIDLKDSKPKFSQMVSFNNIGNIYKKKNEIDLAIEYSRKAINAVPKYDMIINYIIVLLEDDRIDLAKQETENLLIDTPDHTTALNLKTLIAIKLRNFQQAYDTALKVIKISSYDDKAISYFALSSMFLGKYDKADHYLNKSLNQSNSGLMNIQKYFALIENSIRANDEEKKNLYLAQLIERFNIKI